MIEDIENGDKEISSEEDTSLCEREVIIAAVEKRKKYERYFGRRFEKT